VVRNLPGNLSAQNIAKNKPLNQREKDPSVLVPRCGPIAHRSLQPVFAPVPDSSREGIDQDEPSKCSTVSLFLYGEHSPAADKETISFELERQSDEKVETMLKRLTLKVAGSLQKNGKRKNKRSKMNGKEIKGAANNEARYSIWSLRPSEDDRLMLDSKWDCLDKTLRDVGNEAETSPLVAQLSIQFRPDDEIGQKVDETPAGLKTELNFLIEANTPCLSAVRTFEDFDGCLFIGVPILLSPEKLFANHVCVDWYCDGVLVQHDNPCYIPKDNDCGKSLAVVMTPQSAVHSGAGCEEAFRFTQCVEACPENILLGSRPEWTFSRAQDDTNIRVLTYNILSDQMLSESGSYSYVKPKDALRKKHRLPRVLHEVLAYQADVICLQEVDSHIFAKLLEPVFRHYNYQGVFTCKQSVGTNEGCAMFWSLDRFDSVSNPEQNSFAIRDLIPQEEDSDWDGWNKIRELLEKRPDLQQTLQTLGHVTQMVPLRLRVDAKGDNNALPATIIMCNTHLFFHPDASHIRVIQALSLARQSDRIRKQYEKATLVICGDFNSGLRNAGGELLMKRRVEKNSKNLQTDLNMFQYDGIKPQVEDATQHQQREEPLQFNDDFPTLQLPDTYPTLVSAMSEYPPVTHFVPGFVGTLDHILVDSSTLVPVSNAPMPTLEDLSRDTAMPSIHLPSDHVSVVVDLRLI